MGGARNIKTHKTRLDSTEDDEKTHVMRTRSPQKNGGKENKKLRTKSPRPARGSPSPGKTNNKRQETTLTNLRTLENKTYEVQETNKELEMVEEDWDKKITEYRQEIIREQCSRIEKIEKKERKEQHWELYKLCQKYLEENTKEWETRKAERDHEKERQERVQNAKMKSRRAKIKELEKNISKGIEKMTENDRKKYLYEENKKRKIEIAQSKKDLWKLRKNEKKMGSSENVTEVAELKRKTEKIVEILEAERNRIAEEKKAEKEREKIKKTIEKKKQEAIEKREIVKKRWAMYRWCTEYIDENQ